MCTCNYFYCKSVVLWRIKFVDIVIIMTIHYSIIIYMIIIFTFWELTLNLCNNCELLVYAMSVICMRNKTNDN